MSQNIIQKLKIKKLQKQKQKQNSNRINEQIQVKNKNLNNKQCSIDIKNKQQDNNNAQQSDQFTQELQQSLQKEIQIQTVKNKIEEKQENKQQNRFEQRKELEKIKDQQKKKENKQKNEKKQNISIKRPLQILTISDNHGDMKTMKQALSMTGDIFIHAGDFTYHGKDEQFMRFFDFLDSLKFKHKIVISGNHQNVLSTSKLKSQTKMSRQKILEEFKKRNIYYLEHQKIQIQGIKIFASPYTPEYCQKPRGRAFQYKLQYQKAIWDQIPLDTQLLITHGPPYGILDTAKNGKSVGSKYLSEIVKKIKPKYHIFGHIHQSSGMNKIQNTLYLNVCNNPTRLVWK